MKIGTYYLSEQAWTENHIQEVKDCGIDFIIGVPQNNHLLNLLHQNHLQAIVNKIVPSWFGAKGQEAGNMHKLRPLDLYQLGMSQLKNHPAILGVDVGDEPSSLDFDYYAKIIDIVNKKSFAYLNLYPNYGQLASDGMKLAAKELGVNHYQEYIEQYCTKINTPYICYDYYVYSANIPQFYESMEIVSKACEKYQRDFWLVLQVNSHDPACYLSLNQLRYQAFLALCYGVKTIIWACYSKGWWFNQVLDDNLEKTEQYDKLKIVNHEIKEITHYLDDFCYISTYHHDMQNDTIKISRSNNDSIDIAHYKNETYDAYFLVNTSDPYDQAETIGKVSIELEKSKETILFKDHQKQIKTQNQLNLSIKSNQAILLMVKK